MLSKIKWIMFDADNTLLDFSTAEKNALNSTLNKFVATPPIDGFMIYKKVNAQIWSEFEQGDISAI